MAMDKEKKLKALDLIEIPAVAYIQLFFDVQILAQMHQNLISMYETESELKKQHKAYLHVREEADEMCRFDKQAVHIILDHYRNPEKYLNQAICFYNALQERQKMRNDKNTQETGKSGGDRLKEGSKKEMDVFNLPHDMVMMSIGTLGVMQDDMLALTTAVDTLVEAFGKIEESGCNHTEMYRLAASASELARDVFNRWEDADLNELG